ncbi:MAG: hypothetical protein ACLSFJ_04705 [Holdemania filiformis]
MCLMFPTSRKTGEWFNQNCRHNVQLQRFIAHFTVALQGLKAIEILGKIADLTSLPATVLVYRSSRSLGVCLVSRNGYTGEDGVEIYMRNEDAMAIVGRS